MLDLDPATIVRKGRLQPGRMFLVDTDERRIIEDDEIKAELAAEHPYDEWLHAGLIHLDDLPEREHIVHTHASVTRRQQIFGYTEEELRILLTPMANSGFEPIGSMGTDTPIAALSEQPRLLFDYFAQLFAQVTNPPLDAIREELVTSLTGTIGPEANLLEPDPGLVPPGGAAVPGHRQRRARQDPAHQPRRRHARLHHPRRARPLRGRAAAARRWRGGSTRSARRCPTRSPTGRGSSCSPTGTPTAELAPIPSLLLTGAVHHHLVREKTRTQVGLLVEAGDVREVHHVALLVGYGAAAVNPYLAMESVEDLARERLLRDRPSPSRPSRNLVKALGKGVLKVMSKMGVSTVASYTGAQIFEAIGLVAVRRRQRTSPAPPPSSAASGSTTIAEEVARRHATAYPPRRHRAGPPRARDRRRVPVAPRGRAAPVRPRDGVPAPARHPGEALRRLQAVHRAGRRAGRAADDAARAVPVQDSGATGRGPIPIDEVEPVAEIVKRFSTGAMSYGSISPGGPRDPRHRDEPARRQVEHR